MRFVKMICMTAGAVGTAGAVFLISTAAVIIMKRCRSEENCGRIKGGEPL